VDLTAQTYLRSEYFKLSRRNTKIKLIGKANNEFYLAFTGQKDIQLASYDEELNFNWIKTLPEQDKNTLIEAIKCFQDSVYVFHSVNDGLIKRYYLNGLSRDKGQGKEIFKQKLNRSVMSQRFGLIVSRDMNSLLCYIVDDANKTSFNIKYLVFDKDLEIVEENIIKVPYGINDTRIKQVVLDNNQQAYFLIHNRNIQKQDQAYMKYKYMLVYKGLNNVVLKDLGVNNSFLNSVNIKHNPINNMLWIIGFYSNVSGGKIEGIYTEAFDISKGNPASLFKKNTVFSSKLFDRLILKDPEKEQDISHLEIIKVVNRNDGGLLVFGEENYSTIVNYTSPNVYNVYSMNNITYYHYNNVLVTAINTKGEIQWNNILRKKQMIESEQNFVSCFVYILNDEVKCYFNNDITRNNTLMRSDISSNGKINSISEFKDLLYIEQCVQTGRKEWVGLINNNGNIRLIKYMGE
jgi:hypothetical protein